MFQTQLEPVIYLKLNSYQIQGLNIMKKRNVNNNWKYLYITLSTIT